MPASEPKFGEPKKLSGIFISYRRSDNPDAVGRIYDRLVSEFGKARVFKDVDSIPLGQDFRSHLNEIVGGCAAVLAIIGPKWSDTRNSAGQRRLEDPDDFVRIELEAALARNIPVVPVLVGHAPMPGTAELPTSLASMAFRQSIEVRPDPDFHHDATRLVVALRQILDPNAPVIAPPTDVSSRRGPSAWMTVVAAAAIVAAAALTIPALKYLRLPVPPETRLEISTPESESPLDFALSPDGRQIVFVATGDGASRLYLRSLASTAARALPGTEGATAPFWSPDGRSIGFIAARFLKRLDLEGGQPQSLIAVGNGAEGTWGASDVILFVQGPADLVQRIPASGGEAKPATKLPLLSAPHRWPKFLPDGRHFLFSSEGTAPGTYLGTVDGGEATRLISNTSRFAYLPSGWVLWLRSGALVAQQLDVDKAVMTGPILTVADGVAAMSVATTGLIAYRVGGVARFQANWVDRAGKLLGTVGDPDESLHSPRVAPDGRRVALARGSQGNRDLWLVDGERASRMSFDKRDDLFPVWSPDGKSIAYTSMQRNNAGMYRKLVSAAGDGEELPVAGMVKFPSSWSSDGKYLLFFSSEGPKWRLDLWVRPMTGDQKPYVFLRTSFTEVWGQFSPDGKWVAYQSDESGRDEIYVRAFAPPGDTADNPKPGSGQTQVSTSGGVHPLWRADGKEIFYISPAGEMMAAPISIDGSSLVPGAPTRLFQTRILGGGTDNANGRQYDVAPDGRFLINSRLDSGPTAPITLIQNWNPDAGK